MNRRQKNKQIKKRVNAIFDKYEKDLDLAFNLKGEMIWGSCQYDSAKATYDFTLSLLNFLGLEKTLRVLKAPNNPLDSLDEMEEECYSILKDYHEDNVNLKCYDNDPTNADYLRYVKAYDEFKIAYPTQRTPIPEYFELAKEYAFDLWSAYISPFKGLFDIEGRIDTTDNRLPLFNAMASSENFDTGFHCAMLTFLYHVDESCFIGFDT